MLNWYYEHEVLAWDLIGMGSVLVFLAVGWSIVWARSLVAHTNNVDRVPEVRGSRGRS